MSIFSLCATAYCTFADDSRSTKLPKHYWTPQRIRMLEDPLNIPLQLSWRPESYFSEPNLISASRFIMNGDAEKLRELIDDDFNVNATGSHNITLLFWALLCDKIQAFELLLQHGADPDIPLTHGFGVHRMDARFYEGDTVLFAAARRGCRLVPFLKQGVPYSKDINKIGAGEDSLMSLVVSGCPVDSLLQALIEANADINSTDVAGKNLVTRLIIRQQYMSAQLLLDAGADPRFGPRGIERFWRAFEHQRGKNIPEASQQELEQIRQTVVQRLIDDPY